jgi:hypothetical protein
VTGDIPHDNRISATAAASLLITHSFAKIYNGTVEAYATTRIDPCGLLGGLNPGQAIQDT